MKIFNRFLLILVCTGVHTGFCQFSKLDKEREAVYTAATDKERLAHLLSMSKLKNSMHGDTIYYYAQWAKRLAIQLKDDKALAWAEYNLISSDLAKGKSDSVIKKIDAGTIFNNIKKTDTALYYKVQLLKANALNRIDKRTEALELQLKLLTEAEKENNTNARLFALNFIGATYYNVYKPADAKQAWLKGLQIIAEKRDPENEEIEAYILSNLALFYQNAYGMQPTQQSADSFFITINKTISLTAKNENLGVLASALSTRGNFYGLIKNFTAGEKDFSEAVAIRKKIGDPLYILNDIIGLSNFYLQQKKYAQSIQTAEQGFSIFEKGQVKGAEQLQLIGLMGAAYKAMGDYKSYSNLLERFLKVADSSNKINAAEKIAEIQTKYEVQKKETLIAQQKLDLFQRKLLLYGAGILAMLLAIFFIYRFKKYQQRQKIIMEEKRKQHETAVKDAEEKERKRIAAELHDNLGVQANAILHNSSLLNTNNDSDKHVVSDLQETAKEMLHNLRETLWAMKSADVTATDLWLRIINFMKQMGRHYSNINFKVEGLPPENFIIASSQALHIVLVVQESVNNSVKHAGAKEITATSTNSGEGWQILLADDGKGFNLDDAMVKSDSYGLSNMQQRAAEGKFKYGIESVQGKGTSTTIGITAC